MKFNIHTSTSFRTGKIIVLFIVAAVALTATTTFATKNFNSSKSNTSSVGQINEEVGNILLRYNIGGAEINKVTDALVAGIAEEKLITLLTEVGLNAVNVKVALAEFVKLGIASDDTNTSVVSATPTVSPVSVNESGALDSVPAGKTSVSPTPTTNITATPPAVSTPDAGDTSQTGFKEVSGLESETEILSVSALPVKKCGVNTYRVSNECGIGAFKGAYVQCYDGYEENFGGESSCKSSEVWQKYAQEVCANRCGAVTTTPQPVPESSSLAPKPASTLTNMGTPIAICYISDKLIKDYNQLLLDLRKAEGASDKETAELIIKKITALKLEIERARKECLANTAQPRNLVHQELHRPPVAIAINRCQEVSQWENKIAYYQKLSALSNAELKEQTGFSREEIERILAELPEGLTKVKAQCDDQKIAGARPTAAVKQIIVEPVKPVAVGSGREISDYYKAKIEKITSEDSAEAQIQNLQSLKSEIDELIAKLIKGRKEIEISEFDNVVSEIKVSRGEIKADDVSIKTTDKKVLFNPKEYSMSIAPTSRQVEIIEIKDGDDTELKITASEVSIKDNKLRVGNSEVKLAASKVAENLGVLPHAAELKEENARAVYKLKVAEPRKLFGFIPIKITKTLTADAESSDLLDEKLPWYSFLTTR